jgi:hypothetical protein
MSIEVVPQPRIEHLVSGLDGQQLRRTDHRGVAWFGGRQAAQTGGMMVMRSQAASIASPFWLPDSLAYRTEAAATVVASASVGLLYVSESSALAEVVARIAVNDQHPEVSHVLLQVLGPARVPLALSYSVTVLAPLDAIEGPRPT